MMKKLQKIKYGAIIMYVTTAQSLFVAQLIDDAIKPFLHQMTLRMLFLVMIMMFIVSLVTSGIVSCNLFKLLVLASSKKKKFTTNGKSLQTK